MNRRKNVAQRNSAKCNSEEKFPLPKTRQYLRDKFKLKSVMENSCNLKLWEVLVLLGVFMGTYYLYFYLDHFHFHVVRVYAWAGYDEAQHRVGQHYMEGKGVEKHPAKAMEYFRLAADQGHPGSSHNLALGHIMQHVQLKKGEARSLLNHAYSNGVKESAIALQQYCDGHRRCGD